MSVFCLGCHWEPRRYQDFHNYTVLMVFVTLAGVCVLILHCARSLVCSPYHKPMFNPIFSFWDGSWDSSFSLVRSLDGEVFYVTRSWENLDKSPGLKPFCRTVGQSPMGWRLCGPLAADGGLDDLVNLGGVVWADLWPQTTLYYKRCTLHTHMYNIYIYTYHAYIIEICILYIIYYMHDMW